MTKVIKTKVYSLDIKNGSMTSRFLGELNGKRIVSPSKSNLGTKFIDKNENFIRYELLDNFAENEISFLESQLVEAVDMVKKSIEELDDKTIFGLETLMDIFLTYDDVSKDKVLKKYNEILDVLQNGFRFKRKEIFEEKCESFDYVYISTNPDTLATTIYDKFFEHDEYFDRIFTRSSWLIHEASHLTGLREEAGSEVFDNAESYRKFACLICDVATFDELYPNGNIGKTLPLKSNIGRKEFPGPDQPRGKDGKWQPKEESTERSNPDDKDTDGDEPKNNDENSKNKDTNKSSVKSEASFNDKGINSVGNDIWGAIDVSISGLEPDSPYTVEFKASYEQYDKDGNVLESINDNNPSWAYDLKSDSNGNLNINRVGLMGQDTNNRVSDYQGDNIRGNLNMNVYEGKFSDNFKSSADKVTWDTGQKDLSPYQVSMQDKYGLGSYGASHASNNAYINNSYRSSGGTSGGGVSGQTSENAPIKSDSFKFDYNKSSNTPTIKK